MKAFFVTALMALLPAAAFAQTGNLAPSGTHYDLNIIGVNQGKKATLTGSDRHTIYVGLGSTSQEVVTRIYLTQGEFTVCDGNGFDGAYDCAGQRLEDPSQPMPNQSAVGAVFQLPCNTNTPSERDCQGSAEAYAVYARALGKPGGSATMTTCAYDIADNTTECSTESVVLSTNGGQQTFTEYTNQMTSLVDPSGTNTGTRYPLFDTAFKDWFWSYTNNGLKLAQIRFYPCNATNGTTCLP